MIPAAILRPRSAAALGVVLVLVVPLFLPEYASPALVPAVSALAHNYLVAVFTLAVAAAVAWRGGSTGVAGAVFLVALLHAARMGTAAVFPQAPLPARLGLATAAALGAVGALQRWPSANGAYALMAAAGAVHFAGMAAAAAHRPAATDAPTTASAGGDGAQSDLVAGAADADAPKDQVLGAVPVVAADGPAGAADGDAAASSSIVSVPVKVAVSTLPEAPPRVAPFSQTLEEHMVQLRAPPNQATVIWNAPPYGAALGMGTRGACGSFKSDASDVCRRMSQASGVFV